MRAGSILKSILILLVIFSVGFAATAAGKKLGDESDGSRAVPIHRAPLYDHDGQKILASDSPVMPFSLEQSCGAVDCHSVETISGGWHFNSADTSAAGGRVGQPWIYVDMVSASQIPVSYRSWPGTFRAEEIGLTTWEFTKRFGRQFPGGGPGEIESSKPEEVMRGFVSGKLGVNCLACHSAEPRQDQGEFALQVARENFRWAETAASQFASVTGVAADLPDTYDYKMPMIAGDEMRPPAVEYREGIFDDKGNVFFDVVREVPDERCYFCHSNMDAGGEEWSDTEDVHLQSGLKCVDCHRNGLGHNITRGYEGEETVSGNPLAGTLTCRSCHTHQEEREEAAGRLGAPIAEHKGIPPVHFDKLACTGCHSGRRPDGETVRTKTSRAHGLGMPGINKGDDALPHIVYPVFAEGDDGKIGAAKVVWPAYWGWYEDGKVVPLDVEEVRPIASKVITGESMPVTGSWPDLTKEDIKKIVSLLSDKIGAEAVYVAGGKVYRVNGEGTVTGEKHQAGQPYGWPIAHNVRPAAQSLGADGCGECHSADAGFCFGKVEVDTPVRSERGKYVKMFEFQDVEPVYMKLFGISFVFRPWLKVAAVIAAVIIAAVILLYGLKALGYITKSVSEDSTTG